MLNKLFTNQNDNKSQDSDAFVNSISSLCEEYYFDIDLL